MNSPYKIIRKFDSLPEPAYLYKGWQPWHGIRYPTFVNTIEGKKIVKVPVKNYEEHHALIRKLCKYKT